MPKSATTRQRANRHSTATVVMVGPASRPALPAGFCALTLSWWSTIWDSPIAAEWVDADVPGLVALAQLVDDFWTAGADDRGKRHAEVRMASREYGLSPFSRRQLQWEVKRLETAPAASAPVRRRSSRTVLRALA